MIRFTYNNKPYCATDKLGLEKKLKKMNISMNDIVIIETLKDNTPDIDTSIKMYKWYNTKTKHTLTSVEERFPTGLEKYLGDKNDWIKIN